MASISAEGEFERRVRAALGLDIPYTERWPRPAHRAAAVLLLFGRSARVDPENPGGISLLLTRRTESVEDHKGQMAFPGGRAEPHEIASGRFEDTALRETHEEIGVVPEDVTTLGKLPEISIVTGYLVHPFVGILRRPLEETTLRINAGEIAELLWVPWPVLSRPGTYRKEMIQRGQIRFPIHVYQVGEHRIWGATGAMIKNFLDRWAALG